MIRIYATITLGQPPKLKKCEKIIEISSIDICGNYELISTNFSEICLLCGE